LGKILGKGVIISKLLRVEGKSFVAGAVFYKRDGVWTMTDCAPYLLRIIGRTPIEQIGSLLKAKNLKYEWLQTGE
jgi:hypothetical protein